MAAVDEAARVHARNLELQAQLHDAAANTISEAIVAFRRRAELARQLSEAKRVESQMGAHDSGALRLEFEADLAEREADIFETEASTLDSERRRTLAQARTARQKSADWGASARVEPGE
jgi:hypothetical protein